MDDHKRVPPPHAPSQDLDAAGLRLLYARAKDGDSGAAVDLCRRIHAGEAVVVDLEELNASARKARELFLVYVEAGSRGLRAVQQLEASLAGDPPPPPRPAAANNAPRASVIHGPEIQRAKARRILLEHGYLPRRGKR